MRCMRRELERALAGLAARQHQVVTRTQLRTELRIPDAAIDKLVRTSRVVVLRHGVYGLAGCTPDLRGALYAATAGSRTSVASHRAAAHLWRLPGRAEL